MTSEAFQRAAETLRHILLQAISKETLGHLAHTGVRVLIAGSEAQDGDQDPWLRHPECSRHFTTGLGGGSPLFPSTGVYQDEGQMTIVEELFHTIQSLDECCNFGFFDFCFLQRISPKDVK